jgi:disulfide bond formation protein DsbB
MDDRIPIAYIRVIMTMRSPPHPLRVLRRYADQSPFHRAAVILAVTVGALAGAWFLELVVGLQPCKLCLMQRWPYYAALPVAVLAFLAAGPLGAPRASRPAFGTLAIIFMISVGLGAHHAGVEWGWWQGPADCGGRMLPGPANAGDLLGTLNQTRIVSCSEAPFRLLGLSLAGWNAVLSFGLAVLAMRGWRGVTHRVPARGGGARR